MTAEISKKEKDTYTLYVDLMKIQKAFYEKPHNEQTDTEFIREVNEAGKKANCTFGYLMCDALLSWFKKGFDGLKLGEIVKYYTRLWKFHHEWLNKKKEDKDWEEIVFQADEIGHSYEMDAGKDMVCAIVYDLESRYGMPKLQNQEIKINQ